MQKWQKIAVIILGVLVLAAVIVRINLEDILINRLNELVKQDKNRLYDYSYDQLELDLSNGDIILTNLSFKPRVKLLDSLNQLNLGKEIVFDIELEEFKMTGLSIFKFLINGKISLDEINFNSPRVNIYENIKYKSIKQEKKKELNVEKEFFSEIVSSGLKEATIGEFAFQNASVNLFKVVNQDTTLEIVADSSSFSIKGIIANTASLSSNELFYYDSSAIDLRNVKVYSVKDYRIELGRAHKTSTKEDIYFSNIVLSPLEDKYSFMKNKEYQTEWFKFLIKNVIIKDLNIEDYQKSKRINPSQFLIDGLSLEIYKDKRLKKKEDKFKPLLGKKLRNIKLNLNVPRIIITNAAVDYQEMGKNREEPLHVRFTDLDLTISNCTTDSSSLASNDTLSVEIDGTFMQTGKLDLDLQFFILDSNDSFVLDGRLEEMKLNELNPILKNAAFIKFNEGYLNFVEFHMLGNNDKVTGKLDLDYKGLHNLQVLRKKDEMEERKVKGRKEKSEKVLLSFLATNLAPKEYNASSKHYHTGKIDYNRNTNKSILNLIINGIKSGVLNSFLHKEEGLIKKVKEKKEKSKAEVSK